MNDTIYDLGDEAHLTVVFKDADGVAQDQTSVTLTIRKPDGSQDSHTPTHDGTGEYHYDQDVDQAGNWIGKWEGDSDVVAIAFWVRADALAETPPSLYVQPAELKQILRVQGEAFADLAIDIALDSACRAIDGYKRTRFYPNDETRYYTGVPFQTSLVIDELSQLTGVSVDMDGDGVHETGWTEGTDFVLDPPNAALDGRPANELVLLPQASRVFPRYQRAIKVEGTFGWETTPAPVKQAALLLANRLLTRSRSAPLGILIATAAEAVATARLGRIDPDVAFLLDQLPRRRPAFTSLQLG